EITGAVTSEDLAAPGERLRGASVDDVNVEADGQRVAFSSSRARASSATIQGHQLAGIAANSITGEIRDGITRANVGHLTVARVGLPQGQVQGIAAAGVRAEVKDRRTNLSMGRITVSRAVLREGQLDGIADRKSTRLNSSHEWISDA